MEIDDDTLMAFADGELPEDEAKAVQAAMAADPVLARKVERFAKVRRALRMTYDSAVREPVPDRLRALLGDAAAPEAQAPQSPAPVVSFNVEREKRRFAPPAWAALAASLLLGVIAGRALMAPGPSLLVAEGGQLRAGAALARVLDTRLASAAENTGADLSVGVSFKTQDGQYCRTFESVRADQALGGLACRASDAWAVRIATSETAETGAYRRAGSASPAVLAMVDALIAGEPLNAEQERAARDRAWRD